MFLDRILTVKYDELEYRRLWRPIRELKARANGAVPTRDFYAAVKKNDGEGRPAPVNLIAEIKKASPSRGVIRQDFDPVAIARAYELGGARAISILTDETFFQGHADYLAMARGATGLPLLRKDFIISDYQIFESRALGADAVLLITAILAPSQLEDYLGLAAELGLSVLVEVHSAPEAILAAGNPPGARLVGINNRDLQNFKTDLSTTYNLLPLIPPGVMVVSESGIRTHEQVLRLGEAGVDAVLVGEALMEQDDLAGAVRMLLEGDATNGAG